MKVVNRVRVGLALAVLVGGMVMLVSGAPARAQPGQKLDSGLGELPPYSSWVDKTGRQPIGPRVIGEKQDSGLAELPHYRHWKDPTGRDPMGRDAMRLATSAGR